jgi:ribonuclease R
MIPIRTLGREYFHFDAESQTLMGSDSGIVIGLGQRVTVKLAEAAPVTGGLIVELITLEDRSMPQGPSRGRGKPPRRKMGSSRKKAAKTARKVKRTRN